MQGADPQVSGGGGCAKQAEARMLNGQGKTEMGSAGIPIGLSVEMRVGPLNT